MPTFKSPTRVDVLRLLDAIIQEDRPLVDSRVAPHAVNFRNQHSQWLHDPRIAGYGYWGKGARKSSNGGHVIAIYANSDEDAHSLRERVIPESVRLRSDGVPFSIEVMNVGAVSPIGGAEHTRPIKPGCSVSHHKMPSGTLGALARKRGGANDRVYILSCNHVLTEYNVLDEGAAIIQPGQSDRGQATSDTVAELSDMVTLQYDDNAYLNAVDAALACVVDASVLPEGLSSMGNVKISRNVRHGSIVQMVGRTSGLSLGRVIDPAARIHIPYPRGPRSTSKAGFTDVVLCTPFTRRGDSGAAVTNSSREVVGLVLGGSDRATIFCKIGSVCDLLDINLVSVAS